MPLNTYLTHTTTWRVRSLSGLWGIIDRGVRVSTGLRVVCFGVGGFLSCRAWFIMTGRGRWCERRTWLVVRRESSFHWWCTCRLLSARTSALKETASYLDSVPPSTPSLNDNSPPSSPHPQSPPPASSSPPFPQIPHTSQTSSCPSEELDRVCIDSGLSRLILVTIRISLCLWEGCWGFIIS